MNSKEKLQNALNHKPGPIPIDLGGSAVTGIHCETLAKLRDLLGLERKPVKIIEPYQMLGEIDLDLQEALGIDVLPLWDERTQSGARLRDFKEWRTPWGQDVLVPGDFNYTMGEDGTVYVYPMGDTTVPPSMRMPESGRFFDAIDRQEPYDEDNLKLEDNTEEFGPIDDETLAALGRRAKEVSGTGMGVLGSFGGAAFGDIAMIPANSMKHPKGIRGVADWYMLLASDPDFVRQIFDVQLKYVLENLEKIHNVVGEAPDALYVCGTDFGTQIGTFCSIETFRSLYKPYYVAVNDWIHTHTQWKTFKHSCGAVHDFIPEFIDCGFDILNPVQWSAANMDRRELKREFGKDIVFWGGGINCQHTLPNATPKQVYDEALECCRIFGEGGGYVYNTIHNIQAKIPAENVLALFRAVADYNKG